MYCVWEQGGKTGIHHDRLVVQVFANEPKTQGLLTCRDANQLLLLSATAECLDRSLV